MTENKKSCRTPISKEQENLRQGRKSLVTANRDKASNKLRYIEGTTALKDGCWLSGDK